MSLLLKTLRDQLTEGLITRRMELIKSLHLVSGPTQFNAVTIILPHVVKCSHLIIHCDMKWSYRLETIEHLIVSVSRGQLWLSFQTVYPQLSVCCDVLTEE